jgi:hypothetical protein
MCNNVGIKKGNWVFVIDLRVKNQLHNNSSTTTKKNGVNKNAIIKNFFIV